MARNDADMLQSQSGAERGDGVADTAFVQSDDVSVAFDDDGDTCAGHRAFCFVETVENTRLVEQRRLLRIEVFRFPLSNDASSECDAFALRIVDGEHHAIEEAVAQPAVVARERNVRLDHLVGRKSLVQQMAHERHSSRSKAEMPFLGDVAAEPA